MFTFPIVCTWIETCRQNLDIKYDMHIGIIGREGLDRTTRKHTV